MNVGFFPPHCISTVDILKTNPAITDLHALTYVLYRWSHTLIPVMCACHTGTNYDPFSRKQIVTFQGFRASNPTTAFKFQPHLRFTKFCIVCYFPLGSQYMLRPKSESTGNFKSLFLNNFKFIRLVSCEPTSPTLRIQASHYYHNKLLFRCDFNIPSFTN